MVPRKDYEKNCLNPGMLQLADGECPKFGSLACTKFPVKHGTGLNRHDADPG